MGSRERVLVETFIIGGGGALWREELGRYFSGNSLESVMVTISVSNEMICSFKLEPISMVDHIY